MADAVSVSNLPPVRPENGSTTAVTTTTSSNNNNNSNGDSNSSSASLFEVQSDNASELSSVPDDGHQNQLAPAAELAPDLEAVQLNPIDEAAVIAINDDNTNDNDADQGDHVAEFIDLTDEAAPPVLPPILIDDLDNEDHELDDFLVMDDLRHRAHRRTTGPARTTRRRHHRLEQQEQQPELQPESEAAATAGRVIKKRRLSDGEGGGATSASSDAAAGSSTAPPPAPQPADEGCTICFEPWTSAGDHRVCALRCGHLFGKCCVERWLETRQLCPQCNRNTRRHEVVPLYVSNLRALDNSENEALKLEIEKVRRAKLAAEQQAGDMRLRLDMLRDENRRLSRQLDFYRSHSSMPTIDLTDATGETCSYRLEDNVIISQVGECRVLALNQQLNVLCISQPSRNPLFRGYGLRKLDLVDFRNSSYIHLHTNKLRDVCFNPEGTLLLTAGMDKQIRLTGFHSEQTVCYFDCPSAVWSCAWSPFDPNQFYAGLANGRVMCFDMRHTGSHLSILPCAEEPPSVTSVVALASFPASQTDGAHPATLLAGQFDRLSLYRRSAASSSDPSSAAAASAGDDHQATQLPLPGPAGGHQLAWLAADPSSRHALLTHRPTVNHHQQAQQAQQRSGVEHSICSLDFVRPSEESAAANAQPSPAEPALRPLSRIRAGQSMKLLARSRLYQQASRSGGALTVAAGDEASCRLNLWDAATGEKLQSLARLPHPVLDIAPVRQGRFLACLTEQSLYVYKDTKAE